MCTCGYMYTQIICNNETHHKWRTGPIWLQEETEVAKRLTLDKRRINQFRHRYMNYVHSVRSSYIYDFVCALCRVAMAYKPYGTMVSFTVCFIHIIKLTLTAVSA